MQNLFSKCPACGGRIIITECQCAECRLQMRGDFQPGWFSTLSEDELTFIRVFLTARGNLSEVERVLGISYPTIRNKLDEINKVLDRYGDANQSDLKYGTTVVAFGLEQSEEYRKDILQKVADGQLTPGEAIEKLEGIPGEGQ